MDGLSGIIELVKIFTNLTPIKAFFAVLFTPSNLGVDTFYTPEGIGQIETYLTEIDGMSFRPNEQMLNRIKSGEMSIQDQNFYIHEIYESNLYYGGMKDVAVAHLRTLEHQGIPYNSTFQLQLYHPSVIRANIGSFNPAAERVILGLE